MNSGLPNIAPGARIFLPLLALTLAGCKETTDLPARPNILLILADDLGYNETGCYGQEIIQTPNIDRLAREGMRFTQHYSGSPVCAPSRCTLLTGLHTGHSFIRDNSEVGEWYQYAGQAALPDSVYTLAEMLKEQGYTTAVIGKWGLGGPGTGTESLPAGHPNRQGFDFFYGYLCQRQAHNYYPGYLWRNGERDSLNNSWFKPHQTFSGDPANPADYEKYSGNTWAPDLMMQEALNYISDNRNSPFFLFYTTPLPHLALQVPEKYLEPYSQLTDSPYLGQKGYLPHQHPRQAYAGMISALDEQVGIIMGHLRDLGLEKNTLVIFTSDNGATYTGGADTEYFNSNAPFRGSKGTCYEGGIRVPFIARWPGVVPAGKVSDHVSAFWDIFPTLAELTGGQVPAGTDGLSFLPELTGRHDRQMDHPYLYWEYFSGDGWQAAREGDWKAVRRGGEKNPDPALEIYNLKDDPAETRDVCVHHPDIEARFRKIMQERTPSWKPEWNFATQ